MWCGEVPLCSTFPSFFFVVVGFRGEKVVEMWEVIGMKEG